MKYCSKCGNELFDEAVICPKCGCSTGAMPSSNQNVDERVYVLGCVAAAIIPIVGIIGWLVNRTRRPNHAKAMGITGLIAWIVWFLIFVGMGGM